MRRLYILIALAALLGWTQQLAPQKGMVPLWEFQGKEAIGAEFSPDGKLLLTGSAQRKARLFEADTGTLLAEMPGSMKLVYPHWSPSGYWFVTFSGRGLVSQGDVRFWSADGKPLSESLSIGGLRCFDFSRDGRYLAVVCGVGRNYVLRLFDRTGQQLREADFGEYPYDIAFSPDGKTLAVGGNLASKGVELLPVKNFKRGKFVAKDLDISCLLFTGKRQLALATNDGHRSRVLLWDIRKDEPVSEPFARGARTQKMRLMGKGRYLLATGGSAAVTLELRKDDVLSANSQAGTAPYVGACSSGRRAVAGAWEHSKLVVWHPLSGRTEHFENPKQRLSGVDVSPDGRLMVSTFRNGLVKVWKLGKPRSKTESLLPL